MEKSNNTRKNITQEYPLGKYNPWGSRVKINLIFISALLLQACDNKNKIFDSLTVNEDGSEIYFLSHSGAAASLYKIDAKNNIYHPIKIETKNTPSSVTAGKKKYFFVVEKNISEEKTYRLIKYKDESDENPIEIKKSNIFIGSMTEISDGDYVFQLGTKILPSGRVSSKFFQKNQNSPENIVDSDAYGYKYNISLVGDSLVFLDGRKDSSGNAKPVIININKNTTPPYLPKIHFSPNTADFGCNHLGDICFSTQNYTTNTDSKYRHKLIITKNNIACALDSGFHWVEFPKLSGDGHVLAFFTTDDGIASPVGIGARKLILMHIEIESCKSSSETINLKGI